MLIKEGALDPEAAIYLSEAHVMAYAIGATGLLELNKVSASMSTGGKLLMCTDGRTRVLPNSVFGKCYASLERRSWQHCRPERRTMRQLS
jgi:hypothetical protein